MFYCCAWCAQMNMVEKEEGRYRGSTRVGPSAAYLADLRELQAREWALIQKAKSFDLVARPKIRFERGGLAGVNVAAAPADESSTTSFGKIPFAPSNFKLKFDNPFVPKLKIDGLDNPFVPKLKIGGLDNPFVPKLKIGGHFDITSESAGNASGSSSASSPPGPQLKRLRLDARSNLGR